MKSQIVHFGFALVLVSGLFFAVPAGMYFFNQLSPKPTVPHETLPVVWIDLDVHYPNEDDAALPQEPHSVAIPLPEPDTAQTDDEMPDIDVGSLPLTLTPPPETTLLHPPQMFSIVGNTSEGIGTPVRRRSFGAPAYPTHARNEGIEGYVLVEFSVDTHGRTFDCVILESVPAGIFDDAVTRAIQKWRFTPAKDKGGKPIPVRVRQPVQFTLNNKKQ